jgi:hypothetical protein
MYKQVDSNTIIDDNNYRYVGWAENDCTKRYFNRTNIKIISRKVTELLEGVDQSGRPIIVPDKTIISVMGDIYDSYRPAVGDIYGRYNVPTNEPQNYIQDMIDQVIEVITSDVKANIGMADCNKTLSIWNTVYGDFNSKGLRQHSVIKVRDKNTNHRGMVSFMSY